MSISQSRRYCFSNQPHIGQWNLLQFANAIYPLIKEVAPLEEALKGYNQAFTRGWNQMMSDKLGIFVFNGSEDDQLIGDLVDILQVSETDMTIIFRRLADLPLTMSESLPEDIPAPLIEAYYSPDGLTKEQKHRILH